MSITKGAMLISNANAVGAELVNKLGGTGYKPVEWADAINLLGISNDDKASALASITEGTYTGDERGSIKYSNCNAVGSMLNKKFSTDRGFKPVEWESAISKLTPLAEGTVSGSVVSFPNGADDVPLKKCEITLPASLDGYSSVVVSQAGTSYGTFTNGYGIGLDGLPQATASRVATLTPISINPDITYKVYSATNQKFIIGVLNNGTFVRRVAYISSGSNIDTSGGTDLYVCMYNAQNNKVTVEADKPIVFESTETITTHTASLGRTIYGGSVDIVNGEGSEQGYKVVVDGTNLYFAKAGNYYNSYPRTLPTLGNPWKLAQSDEISFGYNSNYGGFIFLTVARAEELGLYSAEEVNAYFAQNPTTIILNLATPTDFTFSPVEINSRLGANTMWSDGDMSVVYRKDPDIPDPPVQVINMNDNENNDN